ncbi:carbamoyltransferase C-terminal domain-containing protein [Roseateles sp. MS654]|uniref:carbamoyltransferase C-terminal domain-containing protein n=1 Tax=Roseateles sp. MS654 TaxID=3412685 RepID=UPI003C2FF93E
MTKNGKDVIVGVSGSHDASACVLIDGEIVSAIQLERLTGIKHDGEHHLSTDLAIKYCLDAAGLKKEDVDCFAFNLQPIVPGYFGLKRPTHTLEFTSFDPFGDNAVFVSHHLAHAFSSFSTSGHSNALCVVADGSGGSVLDADDLLLNGAEFRKYLQKPPQQRAPLHNISVYEFSTSSYALKERESGPSFNIQCGSSSLGETYAAVANYIFGSPHRCGKVMGLAPYGDVSKYETFLNGEGTPSFRSDWKNQFRDGEQQHWSNYSDLAARVQADFEVALSSRFARYGRKYTPAHICYAGGLALNCAANRKIRLALDNISLHIPSCPNDVGISLGCAFAAHYHRTGTIPSVRQSDDFWGHEYSDVEIESAIAERANLLEVTTADVCDLAQLLADQKTVGVYQGGSEFGPRALGHRSIIADARNRSMWERINALVKFREDFRPFAPVCRQEDAKEIFETTCPHPFMVETVMVREKWQASLGAVTHVDGTARLQTVTSDSDSIFYQVITELAKLTDVPVILNTSLNVRSKPIVETPSEAVEVLLCSQLDYLYFPGLKLLISKVVTDRPDYWEVSPSAKFSVEVEAKDVSLTMIAPSGMRVDAPSSLLVFIQNLVEKQDLQQAEEASGLSGEGENLVSDLVGLGILLQGLKRD